MGVDADYLYGYMAKVEDVEWDIEHMKGKYDLKQNLSGFLKEYTYQDLINWIQDDEVDDWYDVADSLGFRYGSDDEDSFIIIDHDHLIKKYPDRKLGEVEELVHEYLKDIGVSNTDIFEWDEYGFFN
jgi:hypothetical protein